MRLTSNIRPISYEIHLNVAVRGYRRAQRSTFDGTVVIALNVSSSTDKIELHSVGLNIKKAELTTSSTVVRITKIEYNRERKTAIFTLAQPLQPTTSAQLKIHYTGKSQMRGIGLYESWTTKYPLPLPTISLVTNCEPTGARRWFPGNVPFDNNSPYAAKSIFEYGRNHKDIRRFMGSIRDDIPTNFSSSDIRVIGRWYSDKLNRLAKSIDYVKSQPAFHNITFISEKTDWMVVDDFPVGAMENPGLITSTFLGTSSSIQVHELAHMYFGNLVTLRSWEQIWINEGFATFFQNMYENNEYQAAQLISLSFIQRYLAENSFGNGDSEKMINYLSMGKPEVRQILQDWVYQAGVAILSVDREETRAIIQQRRFLRTDFNKELRDTKTRWTIPLYYTVNDVEYMTLREIVRVNPSFAANFYHMFTKIFEEDFIEREMRIFKPSIDDDFSYSYYY
ncbi:hypothetical protein PRIPAC_89740 [Pristionchus pacificus]|nr:hypothetical protein PRIPAC_89740 [Pristionchus pacificus]